MKSQGDDQSEFKLLTEYLGLDTDFKTMFTTPDCLKEDYESEDPNWDNLKYGLIGATSIESGMEHYLNLLMKDKHGKQPEIPTAMNMLVPSGNFQFTSLPEDYQKLVMDYYQRQCRNCRQQLQQNAICLLCGEILCFNP